MTAATATSVEDQARASTVFALPETELTLDLSPEGTHFDPLPDSPFSHRRGHDPVGARSRIIDLIEDFAQADPNVAYVSRVVDAIVDRIRARGGCTFTEADVLGYACILAAAEAARAVTEKYVRTVEINLADLEVDEDDER